jgi:hypothetical protein
MIMIVQFLFTQKTIANGFIKTTEKVVSLALPQAYLAKVPPDKSQISRFEYFVDINYCNKNYYQDQILIAKQQGLKQVNFSFAVTTINYFGFVFINIAFLLSLILATPGTWKRKATNSTIGLLLFFIFHCISMIMYMLHIFSGSKTGIYTWTLEYQSLLSTIEIILELGGSLIFIILAWIFLMVRDKSLMSSIILLRNNTLAKRN